MKSILTMAEDTSNNTNTTNTKQADNLTLEATTITSENSVKHKSTLSAYQIGSNNGLSYLLAGFSLLGQKQLRPFVLVPLFINILIFGLALNVMFEQVEGVMLVITAWLPSFLKWLTYIIWPLSLLSVLILFSLFFTTLAHIIAAPFNALLSERVALLVSGSELPPTLSLVKEVPRQISREWQKIRYYLPRLVLFAVLMFLPIIGALIWFLFLAWMMAIQYLDYPFDNNNVSFHHMKERLVSKKRLTLSFGIITSLVSMVPLLNLVVMPAAVCGATLIWLDHYSKEKR